MIIDNAKKEKNKLFILFVDFSKAYDRVPRKMLFEVLKKLGCGRKFLKALIAIYKSTINILNSEVIKSMIGIKKGRTNELHPICDLLECDGLLV